MFMRMKAHCMPGTVLGFYTFNELILILIPGTGLLLLSPFYDGGNWVKEELNACPRFTS